MAKDAEDKIEASPPRAALARWLGDANDVTRMFLAASRIPDMINLAGGLPASETFPSAEIAEIAQRAIEAQPAATLGYGPIEGFPELRDAIAARYSSERLRLQRENVLVITSGMQGLDLIGKTLLDPGDLIAGQTPAYLGAIDAWRPRTPRYRPLRFDAPGFDPSAEFSGAKFVYAVPNFSNPTGKLVNAETRRRMVAASEDAGVWIAEDDPYGGLLYEGELPPRMLDLAAAPMGGEAPYDGLVIYLGTMSKEIAPGLRIGWMIAAPKMIEALTLAKQGSDMCTSGVTQAIALEALRGGLIERLQPQLLSLYRARRDALCAAMAEHLSEWFEWEVPVGGMFVWARARDETLDTDQLLEPAIKAGVCISPSSVFDPTGADKGAIRINFTFNPPEKLEEGVRRLRAALEAMRAPSG